ncbi:MAG TPA: hypothetical protein VG826_33045 [Pirellulales bacterium]|nr:hypothetical protein [Pirellulales bacterium]
MIALVRNGSHGGGRFPTLDLSNIRFPSDGLTVGVLRKIHPELFDIGIEDGENAQPKFFFHARDICEDTVAAMVYYERMLATEAYAEAAGVQGIECCIGDFKNELVELYCRYQLASGPHHAIQLIRDFERQSAALAKQKKP